MEQIPLQAIPRQSFTITLDNVRFAITLQAVGGLMYATISQNETEIVSAQRCMPQYQLIPFRWMENGAGNFSFQTSNGEYPWWENFGIDQFLYYASADELATARNGNAPI